MTALDRSVTIEDLRRLALRRLPNFIGNYLEAGAGDGSGNRRDADAFRKFSLVPRGFAGSGPVDTSVDLFGHRNASMFGISALGNSGIYRYYSDEAFAEFARDTDVPFILSGGPPHRSKRLPGSRRNRTGFNSIRRGIRN
ncbi:isopentenyl diphosphate isomerase/L-lactate dehydrogenase-like FMN-dependent dehydrogenase [Neorhizobium galegae]|nr:isopentenyl diphosphate isomerase/L-lactate dehydrogenase-like FMN-dependent dehydrogenase [Neorhizobium galegae]